RRGRRVDLESSDVLRGLLSSELEAGDIVDALFLCFLGQPQGWPPAQPRPPPSWPATPCVGVGALQKVCRGNQQYPGLMPPAAQENCVIAGMGDYIHPSALALDD